MHPFNLPKAVIDRIIKPKHKVKIGVIGKYIELQDAYKSVYEAVTHAGGANDCAVEVVRVDSEDIEKNGGLSHLEGLSGVLVPGGFGERGVEGQWVAEREGEGVVLGGRVGDGVAGGPPASATTRWRERQVGWPAGSVVRCRCSTVADRLVPPSPTTGSSRPNRHGKVAAWSAATPDLRHDEVCSWGQHGDVTRQVFTGVFLRGGYEATGDAEQLDRYEDLLDEFVAAIEVVVAAGTDPLADVCELAVLGEQVGLAIALGEGFDPDPAPGLEWRV